MRWTTCRALPRPETRRSIHRVIESGPETLRRVVNTPALRGAHVPVRLPQNARDLPHQVRLGGYPRAAACGRGWAGVPLTVCSYE